MSQRQTRVAPNYRRRLRLRASAARSFDAVATVAGLRGWWTPLVSGEVKVGGTVRLEFASLAEYIDLRVDTLRRPRRISWGCWPHSSLPEWTGTVLTFSCRDAASGGSEILFRQAGLNERLSCYPDCGAGWDYFLASLVAWVETGRGAPFGSKAAGE